MSDDDENMSLSTELPGPLSLYSTLLSCLRDSLPPILVVPLYREISGSIERFVIDRVVVSRTFSERGGKQFLFDVEYGWMEAAREGGGLRRPESGMRKLLDAGALLALPAGPTASKAGTTMGPSFATVMRLAWDDEGDGEGRLAEVLEGARVLAMTRDEVKRVLRRRPECWR
jgi:RINT-1 / TIP-1 family